jgi:hypothetical protein
LLPEKVVRGMKYQGDESRDAPEAVPNADLEVYEHHADVTALDTVPEQFRTDPVTAAD